MSTPELRAKVLALMAEITYKAERSEPIDLALLLQALIWAVLYVGDSIDYTR